MPIPLLAVGAAVVGSASAVLVSGGTKSIAATYLKRQLMRNQGAIESWAIKVVCDSMGLPDLMDEKLDRQSFTNAINAKFLAGQAFQFTNIFDAQTIKNDAMRASLVTVAEQAGLTLEDKTPKGMANAIREWIMGVMADEIAMQEVGELTEDARDVWEILKLYHKYKTEEGEDGTATEPEPRPVIDTPEAASNRERQAKYRANHTKIWVER